jgi:hypothetical protein
MYPLSNSSFSYTFNLANSMGVILYSHLEICVIPGCSSMVNSTCQCGGMLGKSSRNTSKNSQTTWISSSFYTVIWYTEDGATKDSDSWSATMPWTGESKCITRAAVSSSALCVFIQPISNIISIPRRSRTIKLGLYIFSAKLRGVFTTICLVIIFPPGVLNI